MEGQQRCGLDSKVILVTGATSGIGKAATKAFFDEGARLVCVGRDPKKGRELTEELRARNRDDDCIFVQADVTKMGDAEMAVRKAIDAYGQLDVLFNNAGALIVQDCTETTEQQWDLMFNTNVKSAFLFSKFAIPWLKKTRGTIINNGSELGLKGAASYSAYCASKAAVVLLTKALALECAPWGIRVNCVCPGATQTAMLEDEIAVLAKGSDVGATKKMIVEGIPLNTIASPTEIASVVLFLASMESSYMTGSIVTVDGGTTLK